MTAIPYGRTQMEWQEALRHRLAHLVRFLLIVGFTLLLGRVMEPLLSAEALGRMQIFQTETLESAKAFNPWTVGELYVCAMMGQAPADPLQKPLYEPCNAEGAAPDALDISVHPSASPQPDPLGAPPQLGHWAQGLNGPYAPAVAFADVAYHLVKRPSVFATVLILLEFLLGYCVTAMLAAALLGEDDGAMLIVIVPVGTVVFGCCIAWLTQHLALWGLQLFGRYLQTAGLCCSAGGLTYGLYEFSLKSFEVKMEEIFGEVLAHVSALVARLMP